MLEILNALMKKISQASRFIVFLALHNPDCHHLDMYEFELKMVHSYIISELVVHLNVI
jgi:hypothetical protein